MKSPPNEEDIIYINLTSKSSGLLYWNSHFMLALGVYFIFYMTYHWCLNWAGSFVENTSICRWPLVLDGIPTILDSASFPEHSKRILLQDI